MSGRCRKIMDRSECQVSLRGSTSAERKLDEVRPSLYGEAQPRDCNLSNPLAYVLAPGWSQTRPTSQPSAISPPSTRPNTVDTDLQNSLSEKWGKVRSNSQGRSREELCQWRGWDRREGRGSTQMEGRLIQRIHRNRASQRLYWCLRSSSELVSYRSVGKGRVLEVSSSFPPPVRLYIRF